MKIQLLLPLEPYCRAVELVVTQKPKQWYINNKKNVAVVYTDATSTHDDYHLPGIVVA